MEGSYSRPTWDEYFMQITEVVAKRSTCVRRQVGAVIVKDRQIVSTGYNGAPRGVAHCLDIGCLRQQLGIPSGQRHEICRGLHAEQNAIVSAAYHGVNVKGGTVYCTHQPCFICAKMIINAGLERVVYLNGYPDDFAIAAFAEAGVEVIHFAAVQPT
ncbi:MAG: cytidine/deoxycytidylate deaminase family protein [Chloroflexi bacterium]|nr:cytidine/deoxycytidylate deaminase family protein [Chloroflexota bacterium]